MKNNIQEKFAMNVASVMALRMSTLPMMWLLNPAKAEKETTKMFSEKEDAMQDTFKQLMTAPMMFWFDIWQGAMNGDRDGGLARAHQQAENRISYPYTSRVSANLRRLSKGG